MKGDKANAGEIAESKAEADEKEKEAIIIREKLAGPAYLKKESERLEKEWKGADERATAQETIAAIARPAVNYELRRSQRLAVAKEGSEMTTDSWPELVAILEDAMRENDLNKAAAAYMRAAETGNENEFQNYFKTSSGGPGMQKFILNQLVGQKGLKRMSKEDQAKYSSSIEAGNEGMGMSLEQALTIGTDVSHTAERFGHWGASRVVSTKNGRQFFQEEDDRQMECAAEMRKLDFENITRRMNRLALGEEVPADDFRITGNREFKLYPSAAALVVEKWEVMPDLMGRGRVCTSNLINLAADSSIELLRKTAQEANIDMKRFEEEFIQELKRRAAIAGTGEHQFDIIKNAQKAAKELEKEKKQKIEKG